MTACGGQTDGYLFLRIEIPTRGIETRQTKKFRVTATFDEVVSALKTCLHPCL